MLHTKQHIPDLAAILKKHGVQQVVISPGSRNGPLINAFTQQFNKHCTSIVDERCAAYFAMGIAVKSERPTVVLSTSGTATLNFAPAVAEAFFLGVPLLVITADRPPEWINQQDNQTIRQQNIYTENSKAVFQLPVAVNCDDELWYAHRMVNEACILATSEKPGPIHINVPLREPLYEKLPKVSQGLKFFTREYIIKKLSPEGGLIADWTRAERVLIIAGQTNPDSKLTEQLLRLNSDERVVILTEVQSNLPHKDFISHPELILSSKDAQSIQEPDLVIYFGGQFISKSLKSFLRKSVNCKIYQISESNQVIDTYQKLSTLIVADAESVFSELKLAGADSSEFKDTWLRLDETLRTKILTSGEDVSYSDLAAFYLLSSTLLEDAIVFGGNSSVIRYLQYFKQFNRIFYSNRGTSGIDGILSTASGLASVSESDVYVILGDLSFVYDSNALWNRNLPHNLKIIVINNQGGGIFSLIEGPDKSEAFADFFEANHPVKINKLAEAFNVRYLLANDIKGLEEQLNMLISIKEEACILEIITPKEKNPLILRDFLNYLKQ